MKKLSITILISCLFLQLMAQDIDLYHIRKNDNYLLPKIDSQMTFQEFYLLSQTFRMQDMLFATVVPGYIHFKAQDNRTAWALVGIRSIATGVFLYENHWLKQALQDSTLFVQIKNLYSPPPEIKGHVYALTGALMVMASTYMFDIIHGKYRLDKKQQMIRYKYAIKAAVSYVPGPDWRTWGYGLRLRMEF